MGIEQHVSDNDLQRLADGELAPPRRTEVSAHLEGCWSCRERSSSLEHAVAGFIRARNADLEGRIPPARGPRALLRARMDHIATESAPAMRFPRLATATAAFACIGVLALALFQTPVNAEGPKPRSGITPGETRPITLAEVCRNPEAEVVSPDIPAETRRAVFEAYGIAPAHRNQFEVDYLITPDLGGAESVRNLWPQPYSVRWNAKVKDRLEQRLHHLVCAGKLDLATAQRDIAMDWIGAYKRYVQHDGYNGE